MHERSLNVRQIPILDEEDILPNAIPAGREKPY